MKFILAGLELGPIDPHDAVPIRVLKTLLRANIPELRSRIQEAVETTFQRCIGDPDSSLKGNCS